MFNVSDVLSIEIYNFISPLRQQRKLTNTREKERNTQC